jgi:hypothetical protein
MPIIIEDSHFRLIVTSSIHRHITLPSLYPELARLLDLVYLLLYHLIIVIIVCYFHFQYLYSLPFIIALEIFSITLLDQA